MIRREDLAAVAKRESFAPELAQASSRAVRILGLGALQQVNTTGPAPWCLPGPVGPWRLTLTAEEARKPTWQCAKEEYGVGYEDARHLARALGAPVEVWGPVRHGGRFDTALGRHVSYPPVLIATVHP